MTYTKNPSSSHLEETIGKGLNRSEADLFQTQTPIDSEDWLLTYTDLVTLLITLFIVMVAHAHYDKFTGNEGPFDHISPNPVVFDNMPSGTAPEGKPFVEPKPEETAVPTPEDMMDEQRKARAAELKEAVNEAGLKDSVEVEVVSNTIELRINEKVLFPSAKADLFDQGQGVLESLVGPLIESGSKISVEGHTDNIPISTGRFASNWELSAARAISVIHFLESHGIPEDRLQAVAFADTKPIEGNDTEEGRQKNRRVQIVLK